MTILEAIQRSAEFLAKKGVESPRLQVELLLAHVLKMPRMKLYLNFERTLTDSETDALRPLVQRRGMREPLQYIIGSVSFCGLELVVTKDVLIPRPETELLAEFAWKFLESRAAAPHPPHVLDLGAGSGCLAIAIAIHVPTVQVCATDISPAALTVARQNIERHNLAARVSLREGDSFAAVPRQSKFTLIVSNPPYIPTSEIAALYPEVREFEPRAALDGGPDGLDILRRIAAEAATFLESGGRLMLELEEDGADSARRLFSQNGWTIEALHADFNAKPRILIARAAD